jgi:hypothetical protein
MISFLDLCGPHVKNRNQLSTKLDYKVSAWFLCPDVIGREKGERKHT